MYVFHSSSFVTPPTNVLESLLMWLGLLYAGKALAGGCVALIHSVGLHRRFNVGVVVLLSLLRYPSRAAMYRNSLVQYVTTICTMISDSSRPAPYRLTRKNTKVVCVVTDTQVTKNVMSTRPHLATVFGLSGSEGCRARTFGGHGTSCCWDVGTSPL